MKEKMNKEQKAKAAILKAVSDYASKYSVPKAYKDGDRIPYAARVFDAAEMTNLVDSSLEFWLTAGRFAGKFEKDFAAFLNVKYSLLVNSGSSANLLAFMTL